MELGCGAALADIAMISIQHGIRYVGRISVFRAGMVTWTDDRDRPGVASRRNQRVRY